MIRHNIIAFVWLLVLILWCDSVVSTANPNPYDVVYTGRGCDAFECSEGI